MIYTRAQSIKKIYNFLVSPQMKKKKDTSRKTGQVKNLGILKKKYFLNLSVIIQRVYVGYFQERSPVFLLNLTVN